jgi:amidophosphoribosyltransferase
MAKVSDLYAPAFMKGMTPTADELEAMAKALGADTLRYLPLDALARCIELPESQLCRACVTGDYPTENGRKRYELEMAGQPTPVRDACAAVQT